MTRAQIKRIVKNVIRYDLKYNLGLCYGLSPNPWGFTFDGSSVSTKRQKTRVSQWLTEIEL